MARKHGVNLQRRRPARLALLVLAVLPAGCALLRGPTPAERFAGDWATPERQRIAFRGETLVVNPADAPPAAMTAQTCDGTFRFGYRQASRAALLALAPRQPDVTRRLAALLVRPDYPVAELTCGEGRSTYVLLDERDLVAIHRDRDIAGIERLTRL